jgi:hypothetical protein
MQNYVDFEFIDDDFCDLFSKSCSVNQPISKYIEIEFIDDIKLDIEIDIKPTIYPKVLTEDLGKIFEMAICKLYNIKYDGKFKYNVKDAEKIVPKIKKLKDLFPYEIRHIAKNGNKYDFENINGPEKLSAKTTKKDGKVCPQVIGQPSRKKFCEFFRSFGTGPNVILNDNQSVKKYIEENIKSMLKIYFENTFDCPIIYYNKHKNKTLFINKKQSIIWNEFNIIFSHIKKNKLWNESSTISINNKTIGEFQIHNNRDCIKFRWMIENLLNLFKDNFEITII